MALGNRWASRNLSRLEMVVALLFIAIFVGAYVERGLRIFTAAEESGLQTAVLNMNSALRVLFYDYSIAGRVAEVAGWQGANPIRLLGGGGGAFQTTTLGRFPELGRFEAVAAGIAGSYHGEVDAGLPPDLSGGEWYFDRSDGALVYRVRNAEFFHSDLPGPARVRFRLAVRFDDPDRDGKYNPETDRPVDVMLRPLDKFHWSGGSTGP